MCLNCFDESECDVVYSVPVEVAVVLIDGVYEYSIVGGNGHVVFDDYNVEDSSIDFCLDLTRDGVAAGSPQEIIEYRALSFFKTLSIDERYSALAARSLRPFKLPG